MFHVNDKVVVKEITNVRRSPGYINKDGWDVFITVQPGQTFPVASGPYQVDEIDWYELDLGDQRGFVAAGHNGDMFLEVDTGSQGAPGCGIVLTRPLHGSIPLSQHWGENPAFYAQLQGYNPPLRGHNGRDYAAPAGSSVLACDDGAVERAEANQWGFGNLCVLRHSWGRSFYAHLSAFDVGVGAWVHRGQHIARSGNTGLGMGSEGVGQHHLHFSIKIYGQDDPTNGWGGFSDPTPYLDNPY